MDLFCAIMAPADIAAGLRMAVGARGGTPVGLEDTMIELCRSRLRARVVSGEAVAVRRAIVLSALVPLIRYLQASLGVATFQAISAVEGGDIIFEFIEVILRRTKLQVKFRDIFW